MIRRNEDGGAGRMRARTIVIVLMIHVSRSPPFSSRTVGFPEPGWRQGLSLGTLPKQPEAQVPTHIHPLVAWFDSQLDAH